MAQHRNLVLIFVATVCLLMVPLAAGWPWDLFDFAAAGALLLGTGLAFELVARKGGTSAYRAAVGLACATGLLLVWMNLAVGLIGNENNPANLLFLGVPAVGLFGAFMARLAPRGMAFTLFATAIAQALVPLLAFLIWRPSLNFGVVQVLGVNTIFVCLWVASAALFRQAGVRSAT